jgi:hypothetical protein
LDGEFKFILPYRINEIVQFLYFRVPVRGQQRGVVQYYGRFQFRVKRLSLGLKGYQNEKSMLHQVKKITTRYF